MQVVISDSDDVIEQACKSFEKLLSGTDYYSDDTFDDVTYTVNISKEKVDQWIAANGFNAAVFDED
jgi:hypothetical protein